MLGLVVLSVVVVNGYIAAQTQLKNSKIAYVAQVCDAARLEISGESENACGDAQDKAGAEYKCTAMLNNKLSCYVEVK